MNNKAVTEMPVSLAAMMTERVLTPRMPTLFAFSSSFSRLFGKTISATPSFSSWQKL